MKTSLLKLGLLTFCLTGFSVSGHSQYNIHARGNLEIIDPNYSTTNNYYVFAWLEIIDNGSIAHNPNPFIGPVSKGYQNSGDLYWYDVYPPDPEPLYPFRIKLVAVRISPYAVSKAGYSDWGGPYDLDDPWSPDPIELEFD